MKHDEDSKWKNYGPTWVESASEAEFQLFDVIDFGHSKFEAFIAHCPDRHTEPCIVLKGEFKGVPFPKIVDPRNVVRSRKAAPPKLYFSAKAYEHFVAEHGPLSSVDLSKLKEVVVFAAYQQLICEKFEKNASVACLASENVH